MNYPKVTALAGGVGGAKLVYGLAKILPKDYLTVIVNTGDDFDFYGLHISPDIDSIIYNLAEISDPIRGYGRANDSFRILGELRNLGEDIWFHLGDLDFALNLYRSYLLRSGISLTKATEMIGTSLGLNHHILPMSDEKASTKINTRKFGILDFQEYFVKYKFEPEVENINYSIIKDASMTKEAISAIINSDIILFCPSNPWLSIFPILKLRNVEKEIKKKKVVAVSPIIGNDAVKGPAAKLFRNFGLEPSARAVAEVYKEIIDILVIDNKNENESNEINNLGIKTFRTDIMMGDNNAKIRLAGEILRFLENNLQ
ncbi:MAG: 2-phospho-L-lactate transferase [Candidatus Atribacteria bacterium]|nr:2-phospho-L-lactate transferase [Candidatus Atribacteria bacterium]